MTEDPTPTTTTPTEPADDVTAAGAPVSDVPVSEVPVSEVPPADVPVSGVPVSDVPPADVPLMAETAEPAPAEVPAPPAAAPSTQTSMAAPRGLSYAVDIVFCIDVTGSMTPIIDQVKANALRFYDDVQANLT